MYDPDVPLTLDPAIAAQLGVGDVMINNTTITPAPFSHQTTQTTSPMMRQPDTSSRSFDYQAESLHSNDGTATLTADPFSSVLSSSVGGFVEVVGRGVSANSPPETPMQQSLNSPQFPLCDSSSSTPSSPYAPPQFSHQYYPELCQQPPNTCEMAQLLRCSSPAPVVDVTPPSSDIGGDPVATVQYLVRDKKRFRPTITGDRTELSSSLLVRITRLSNSVSYCKLAIENTLDPTESRTVVFDGNTSSANKAPSMLDHIVFGKQKFVDVLLRVTGLRTPAKRQDIVIGMYAMNEQHHCIAMFEQQLRVQSITANTQNVPVEGKPNPLANFINVAPIVLPATLPMKLFIVANTGPPPSTDDVKFDRLMKSSAFNQYLQRKGLQIVQLNTTTNTTTTATNLNTPATVCRTSASSYPQAANHPYCYPCYRD